MKYNPLATQKEIDAWYCSLSFRDKMNGWIFPHNSHFWNKEHTKEEIESIKKYECEICGTSKWMDKTLTLQLDHINGDNIDNRIENLRIICPNCHSQTETFSIGLRNAIVA